MKNKQLLEVSYDELASDKTSKFFFHGLTGNEIEKIKKPTAHDPFFVTNKLSIAKLYAKSFGKNLIYILRLNETKYFNFRKKSDWMKICKNSYLAELFQEEAELAGSLMDFSTDIGICFITIQENDKLMNKLKDQKTFNEYLKIISSEEFPEDFYDNEKYSVLESFLDNESSFGIISLWLIQFCRKDFIAGKLYLNLKDVSHGGDGAQFRRTIKEILFKLILERTSYKIVGEADTSDIDIGAEYPEIAEFAILDLSVIKDIYPYPVKVEDASKILKQLKDSRK